MSGLTSRASDAPSATSGYPAPHRLRVLVVDDMAPLRRLLARQLTQAGHEVVGEAATAAEAVACARRLRPDVLLLDVHLPDGLGIDVAGCLASGGTVWRPAVVFCTGDVAGALALGAGCPVRCGGTWAVLEKPTPSAVLDAAIREAPARIRREHHRGYRAPGTPLMS